MSWPSRFPDRGLGVIIIIIWMTGEDRSIHDRTNDRTMIPKSLWQKSQSLGVSQTHHNPIDRSMLWAPGHEVFRNERLGQMKSNSRIKTAKVITIAVKNNSNNSNNSSNNNNNNNNNNPESHSDSSRRQRPLEGNTSEGRKMEERKKKERSTTITKRRCRNSGGEENRR